MDSALAQLASQWTNPSDVLSVLLIIGGDIVQKALAQTSGGLFTPVCFSFGWVGYSFTALIGIIGDGRLMPEPDYPVKVFNLKSGYARENKNWIVGRLLRDNEIRLSKTHPLGGGALRISIYEAQARITSSAIAGFGRVRVIGVFIMLLQLGIAAIPAALYLEWGILVVTSVGTLLAVLAGWLPQWRAEKLPNRRTSHKNFALTSGNGSRDIMIVLGCGNSLDLEELAASETPRSTRTWEDSRLLSTEVRENGKQKLHGNGIPMRKARTFRGIPVGFWITNAFCVIQSVLWIALLISVAGLRSHTWYLLLVGGLGMFQNATVAAISRGPEKRGLPLILLETIRSRTVMDGLMDLEVAYTDSGRLLLHEFFPGSLRSAESDWWNGETTIYDKQRSKEMEERGTPWSMMPRYRNSIHPTTSFSEKTPNMAVPNPASIPASILSPGSPRRNEKNHVVFEPTRIARPRYTIPESTPESTPADEIESGDPMPQRDLSRSSASERATIRASTRTMSGSDWDYGMPRRNDTDSSISLSMPDPFQVVQSPDW